MQVTKGTWRMREQCVPGSLSSSHAREPGNEARLLPECSAGYLELRRLKLKQTWRVGINVATLCRKRPLYYKGLYYVN